MTQNNPDISINSTQPDITHSKELSPLPLIGNFIGYNCRTYAIASVMKWMYETNRIATNPLPARKMDFLDYHGMSLRKIAKQKYHSATGEIYNIEDLAALAKENMDITAQCVTCTNENDYINRMIAAIDANHAPVIFFDANPGGLPGKFNGQKEHAAVVVGYTIHSNNEVTFKVGQWEKYYEFNAKELYQSSVQLLRERSGEDIYSKVKSRRTRYAGHSGWMPAERVIEDKIDEKRIIDKKQVTSPTSNGGFAGKILILEEKPHPVLTCGK